MPIYKDKNLLFIHIPKCAGSFIDDALSAEKRRKLQPFKERMIGKLIRMSFKKHPTLFGILNLNFNAQHLTLMELVSLNLITEDELKNLEIFTVVRNPIDRFKSAFLSHNRFSKYEDINHFASSWLFEAKTKHDEWSHCRPMYDFIDGKYIKRVKIFKFEELDSVKTYLGNKYPIKFKQEKINASKTVDERKLIINPETEVLLQNYYKKDFSNFKY